ncbi:hypothetical protein B0T16DRAFT_463262 [Cercophora newfieldiana]|uniref:Uncharacterized protein n=1 Tax=Cercophora newfieldiana TaxID=92897 RepID=A0AA39XTP0_9PEZI|nr:hypothetical protein B0T16DRAFT_463262 [Cercophora newfieldiana]
MGLVLASSESLDSDLSSSFLTEHRHFQGRPHLNPRAKHPRRPFHWSQPKSLTRHDLAAAADLSPSQYSSHRDPLPHHLTLYHANLARHRTPRPNDPYSSDTAQSRRTHQSSSRKRSKFDSAEGIALARAQDVQLPGEDRRPPSLERQDAFRDGSTAKRKRGDGSESSQESQESQREVEELYRMGLLYDDEHLRGEGFSLGSIAREREGEVVWNVRYRPEKRRGRAVRRDSQGGFQELNLALSFARLGEDEALRAWLVRDEEEEEEEEEGEEGEGGIFRMERIVETCAGDVDESRDAVEETIEERIARIKSTIAATLNFDCPVQDEEMTGVEEQDMAVTPVETVTNETIDQRVTRIKSELGALYQKKIEEQSATTNTAEEDFNERDEAYYQDLIVRFEKLKRRPTAQEANNDDNNNDDWAFLDMALDGPSGNDTTTAIPVDIEVADDTWIMLGSDGS